MSLRTGRILKVSLLVAIVLIPCSRSTQSTTAPDDAFETPDPFITQTPDDTNGWTFGTPHFDTFGQHDANYDHDLITGSMDESRYFKQLEPEEAKTRLGEMFERMDVDRDGQLDREELTAWIVKSFINLDTEMARIRLKDHDSNQDGVVTWSEYTGKVYGYSESELDGLRNDTNAETQAFIKSVDEERVKFDSADRDHDGRLNETEYAAFEHPHNYQHMAPYEMIHTLRTYDADHDGRISEKEYLADDKMQHELVLLEKANFKRYDENGDGVLDEEEMRKWITPGFQHTASEETEHLFAETDRDKDGKLSKDEVIDQHELWVGSQATDYGRHLEQSIKDEL